MKKNLKLLSVVAITGAMTITGCTAQGEDEHIDKTKAQLTVLTYDGGVGDEWLNKAARAFEALHSEDTGYQDGKVGVQIRVTKQRVGGDTLKDSDLTKDMYFTENVNYFTMRNKNKMLDITDVLTAENPNDNNKRIIDKIDSNLLNFMNSDGKYYAVPFYDCIYGLFYDKDLFMEESFYVTDEDPETGEISFTSDPLEFGKGPNNIAGDWDDGLPKTYDQFKLLLAQIRNAQMYPYTYVTNKNMQEYMERALMSYWSDDEGLEQTNLNYTFDGLATDIVTSFNNKTPVTESVQITKENGYLLRKEAGIYNSLYFADEILHEKSQNYVEVSDVKAAQLQFVAGGYKSGTKNVAMIFEGTWWQNEAVEAFKSAEKYGRESFNFGIMPIPKSSDTKVGEDATFLNLNASYGFINPKVKNKQLAKDFLAYLHEDAQLKAFTLETGMTRALNYTMDEEEYAELSTFTKDLIAIKQSEHANLIYPYSGEKFVNDNPDTFDSTKWVFSTKDKGTNPVATFHDYKSFTAKEYFQQHYNLISESNWKKIINVK